MYNPVTCGELSIILGLSEEELFNTNIQEQNAAREGCVDCLSLLDTYPKVKEKINISRQKYRRYMSDIGGPSAHDTRYGCIHHR